MTGTRRMTCDDVFDAAPMYVLGALETGEMARVREHLADCTRAHDEMRELGGVVPYLAELAEPVEPPAELRARIMDVVTADVRGRARDDAAAERLVSRFGSGAPQPSTTVRTDANEEPISLAERRRLRSVPAFRWAASIAAGLLIAVLAGSTLYAVNDAAVARERANQLRDAITASTRPDARVAHLTSTSGGNQGGFAAFPPGGNGYLVVTGLAPAPAGKTYEAWYASGNAMRYAGLVTVGSDGVAILTGLQLGTGNGVAITLEQAGGVDQPTSAPIVSGQLGG